MARERTLLQRVNECGERGFRCDDSSATEDLDALMESVRNHLARLLNARHGMSEATPDYGLPALTDLTACGAEHVPLLQKAIQETIEKYEPRLRRVRVARGVDATPSQSASFRVEAILISDGGQHRVCYETMMAGDGRFDVAD